MPITVGTDGYCTIEDVEAILQQRTFTASGTKPTIAEVEEFITDGFQEMNGILEAVGISVPVAAGATKSISILKRANAAYAAAMTERAVYSAGTGGAVPGADAQMAFYEKRMTRIEKGTLKLSDATLTTEASKATNESPMAGEFNLDDDGDERDPTFKRDMTF